MTAQKKYASSMPSNQPLYDRDFYAWTNEQAALIRAGNLAGIDVENVAEEIESMGRSERNELTSRLTVLLLHLLKWKFQPALQGKSWLRSIREQRKQSLRKLEQNPSLKPSLSEIVALAYLDAVDAAEDETGQDKTSFPDVCPWEPAQFLTVDWLPN